MGTEFEITERYNQLVPIGVGVSGLVCSANDQLTHQTVAVKKLHEPFKSGTIAKHMFREVKLLKQLQHENVLSLTDILISPSQDIYVVTERMAVDLHTLLQISGIDGQFIQYFLCQMMRGLKYIHSAGVLHRDLKPSNILINENCDLKICDFGQARLQEARMTGYVCTRHYRAPEIMLSWQTYNEKIDIWSAGCIFAEMMLRRPLFPGENHIDQFYVIVELRGSPPDGVIANITSQNTFDFVQSLPKRVGKPMSYLIPGADAKAITLLECMLQFSTEERISAAEALSSQYLSQYHDPTDEPTANKLFDWSSIEANLPAEDWKHILFVQP